MRFALVCKECFDVHWIEHATRGVWRGRDWWTCGTCVPDGGYQGEYRGEEELIEGPRSLVGLSTSA